MKLAAAEQMRKLDRDAMEKFRIPSIDLMERAGQQLCRETAELLAERPGRRRVSIFCGAGNNGGDGIAAARLLFLQGVRVRVFLVGSYEKLTSDALEMTGRLSECGIQLEAFDPESREQQAWALGSQVLIDALFGVGLSREIAADSPFAAAAELMNRAGGTVLAADIASGVEADTGRILGCAVKADRTVTFTLPKIGQFVGDGVMYSGQVRVREIGIPETLVCAEVCTSQTVGREFVRAALPPRKPDGHKGTFGKLLAVGGSVGFTGAPYLMAAGAVRSGCGLVYLGVPEEIWEVEAHKCVSSMPFPLPGHKGMLSAKAFQPVFEKLAQCGVLALGPGLGRSQEITEVVCALLRQAAGPVVLDADGINALAGHMDVLDARQGRVTILTPHEGEFLRLEGASLDGGRSAGARDFARRHGCTLVLKGHRTLTAAPAGTVLVNTTGNSGLAKGGSGDMLTGVIASLLCQGATPVQAAAAGVWLHGRAGDLAAERKTAYAMSPQDAAEALPLAFADVLETESVEE